MSGPCCARSGHGVGHCLHRDVYQLSLRTRLRCSEFIQPNPSRPWQLGYPVTVTSPADIGRLTTAIYLHQPRIVNEVVFVAGETTSYRQLADTVERVTQQTFSKAVHTLPALLEQLRTNPDDAMLRYRAAFARGWRVVADGRHGMPATSCRPGHCRLAADRALIFSHRTE